MISNLTLEINAVEDKKIQYVTIMTRFRGNWIFVRQNINKAWEIPNGKRNKGESTVDAAIGILKKIIGEVAFIMVPVCLYTCVKDGNQVFGKLFYSEISFVENNELIDIYGIEYYRKIPENLGYPIIHSILFKRVIRFLNKPN